MSGSLDCPDLETLQRFKQGLLPEAEASKLRRHKLACPKCAQTLQGLGEDTQVNSAVPSVGGAKPALRPGWLGAPARGESAAKPPSAPQEDAAGGDDHIKFRPAEQPGELGRLGGYRVLKLLSHGGMGLVYEAEDVALGRRVALKVIRPEQAVTETAKQRFLQEARAVAAIEHEHIVTIYQVGEDCDVHFLAMQLLQGESLADRLQREGRLSVAEVVRIGRQMAEGLEAAHDRGLIHRDIKPANIFLERLPGKKASRVKILDFGLARQATAASVGLTQSGLVIGTPGYMAPEQARSLPLDERCDLFSVGCVLFHMATGEPPFRGDDPLALLVALTVDPVTPLSKMRPEVPAPLSDLVERMLAKSRFERPATAALVAQELSQIEQKLTHTRLPTPVDETPIRREPSPDTSPAHRARPEDTGGHDPAEEPPPVTLHPRPEKKSRPKLSPELTPASGVNPAVAWKALDSLPVPNELPPVIGTRARSTMNVAGAPEAPAACPRCGAPAKTLTGKSWCLACGWSSDEEEVEEPEEKIQPPSLRAVAWVVVLLGGLVAIIVLTSMRRRILPGGSNILLWWIVYEGGLGLLGYAIGHAWSVAVSLRRSQETDIFKYTDPFTVWRNAIEYLPTTRVAICLATWGVTAFACAVVVMWVNNFAFKDKGARDHPGAASAWDGGQPEEKDAAADYADADESLDSGSKDPSEQDINLVDLTGLDSTNETPKPIKTECVIIGYIATKLDEKGQPVIEQLLLGVPGEDGTYQFVGTIPVGESDELKGAVQKIVGQLKPAAKPATSLPAEFKNAVSVETTVACTVNYTERDAKQQLKNPVVQGFTPVKTEPPKKE